MAMGSLTWTCLFLAVHAGGGEVWHMNVRGFQIPIRTKPESRASIRDLELYVSRDQGQTWEQQGQCKPDKEAFTYTAPADGSYWFKVVVVDVRGQRDPQNPALGEVGQRIFVDTVKPEVRVTAERQGDDVLVRWNVREDNPDWPTFKVEYRSADTVNGLWTPVAAMPDQGQVTIHPSSAGPILVRVQVQDLAGNLGQEQKEVPAGGVSLASSVTSPTAERPPVSPPNSVLPAVAASASRNAPALEPEPRGGGLIPLARPAPRTDPPPTMNGMPLATEGSRGSLPPLRIINKRQAKLDFEVAKFGPSGLGSVDVYVTTDEGATWERMPGDANLSLPPTGGAPGVSPVKGSLMVPLAREATIYGFYIIVKSRAGLGKAPPRNGDPPQIRLEADTTLPEAELYSPQPDPNQHDVLVLTWKASDHNLTATPISLEWAEHKDGPWFYIGDPELPNTGTFPWQVPSKAPPKVYLKLTVRDKAGNQAVAQTNEPILVDLSVPEVSFIGLGASR
jgi:hypothetical protein